MTIIKVNSLHTFGNILPGWLKGRIVVTIKQHSHVLLLIKERLVHDQILDVGDIDVASFQLPRLSKVVDPNEERLVVPVAVAHGN